MSPAERARPARWSVAAEVLTEFRSDPGVSRSVVARRLGIGSGVAAEVTARLREARLIMEVDGPPSGRGRPSATLRVHPDGPLVLIVELRHEAWRLAVAALDGRPAVLSGGAHPPGPDPHAVLAVIGRAVRRAHRDLGSRLRAVSVSVPGVVGGSVLRQASGLGWKDVELAGLVEGIAGPLIVGNDATFAGVAEVRRGAAVGATTVVHLQVEEAPGGALVVDGRPIVGASGAAGEFGHLPFADRRNRCGCGAYGCWGTAVGARALAAALGEPEPVDPRALARRVRSAMGVAVAVQSAALGTGLAALVNALDPDVVTIGGIAIPLRASAPTAFEEAYLAGLMGFRRDVPPPVRDSTLGDDGALIGAAEVALDEVTTPEALALWAES